MHNTDLQSATVEFGRWNGEGKSLVPNGVHSGFSRFGFLLFDAFVVDHQVQLHQRIFRERIMFTVSYLARVLNASEEVTDRFSICRYG